MRFFSVKTRLVPIVAALIVILPGLKVEASHTEPFSQKAGFERQPKDIINTLKDNQSTSFQTLLDGLQQAFDLDKTLKDEGPYTLFAPTDKAFKHISLEDIQNLFGNKKKLREVMMYHIVTGKADAKTLRAVPSIKTMDGRDLPLSTSGGDLYVGKALVLVTDIPCTNGTIHILDQVDFPPQDKQ
jgi:uncharacterized surface protein with fasciclin (FAS1) repeats